MRLDIYICVRNLCNLTAHYLQLFTVKSNSLRLNIHQIFIHCLNSDYWWTSKQVNK
jgi:hypothetical protein